MGTKNKKYKVGIFSNHLWILVSFVLRIQTRSIRLVSFHSTYGFLYPLFYAFKQKIKAYKYANLLFLYQQGIMAERKKIFYANKKYKVGIFSPKRYQPYTSCLNA